MLAARKSSGKSEPEMFDDIPVLKRKWQAAVRPGEKLPRRRREIVLHKWTLLVPRIQSLRAS